MAEGADRDGKEKIEGPQDGAPVPSPSPSTSSDAATSGGSSEPSEASAEPDAEPAWPPREAAPREVVTDGQAQAEAVMSSAAAPDAAVGKASGKPDAPGPMTTTPVMLPPTEADAQGGAALPGQEMGFSDSTLHWLQDGETGRTTRPTSPTGSLASYDPRAPIAGRRRAYFVVGGAGLIALIIAGTLFFQAKGRPTPGARTAAAEPARDFTARAEAALSAKHLDEALELAHLALTADPRYADAHFVLGSCERARNQPAAARAAYRKYLELAPLGLHAAEARQALDSLQ